MARGPGRGCGWRYAPCKPEQDSPPSACLSATPSSRLGGKGQEEKKNVQVTHWPSQAGGHTQEEGEARRRWGASSEAGLEILLLTPFVDTS